MKYKILMASSDINCNNFCSIFLENKKIYEIEKTTTGLGTLNRYFNVRYYTWLY